MAVRDELVERAQRHSRHDAQLLVDLKEGPAGQPVYAAVNQVRPAVPGGADTAKLEVVLDDGDIEVVCTGVTASR